MKSKYLTPLLAALLLAVPILSWAQKDKSTCFVTLFKSQVLKIHDPEQRSQVAEAWLKRNLASCTSAQMRAIQSNSPLWLGTALTAEVSSLIEVAIEASISGNQAMMDKLYGSSGKEGTASTATQSTGTPRSPIVQVPIVNAPVAGAVNYGRITGDTIANSNTNATILQNGNSNINLNNNLNAGNNNSARIN